MIYARFKKNIPILLLGIMLLVLPYTLWSKNLEIHYINVQWGQSILIKGPDGTTILLDGGSREEGTKKVVPYLKSIGIPTTTTLDYIIATHLHSDHFAGLTSVMKAGYDAKNVYYNGSDVSDGNTDAFKAAAQLTSAGSAVPMPLDFVIEMGDAKATCVAVNGSVTGVGLVKDGQENENDRSIALLIKYGDFDYLVHGDLGGGSDDNLCTGRFTRQANIETPLVRAIMPGGANPLLTSHGVEIVHVSHHGSESSTNSDFMSLLTPTIACISTGEVAGGSGWDLPRKDVVENVLLARAPCVYASPAIVLQTAEGEESKASKNDPQRSKLSTSGYCVGDILITTDGVNTYSVSANGEVGQGPDERTEAGLPIDFEFDEKVVSTKKVVFSEVFYDAPGSDSEKEWIELYNNSETAVNISGWTIVDSNGTGKTYIIPAGNSIAPGKYFTIARNKSGFTRLYGYGANLYALFPSLNNKGDSLVLKDLLKEEIDRVAWEGGDRAGMPPGWGSNSLPKASTGYSIVRSDVTVDTDTYSDWSTASNNGDPQTE
jgi:beta-lactamase superfamily II metal-dependent hydrolase